MTDQNDLRMRGSSAQCPAIERPMTTFCRLLRELLAQCDELEAIADSLPHNIDRPACAAIASRLPALLGVIHRVENQVILRLLRESSAVDGISFNLDRLEDEHQTDSDYAIEVSDMLMALASDSQDCHMEHAGYLLRGFFHGSRRHVSFDLECVIPQAVRHLRNPDLERMRIILEHDQTILSSSCIQTREKITIRQRHEAH